MFVNSVGVAARIQYGYQHRPMTNDPSLLRIPNIDNIQDLERQKRLPCVLPPEVEAAILNARKTRVYVGPYCLK